MSMTTMMMTSTTKQGLQRDDESRNYSKQKYQQNVIILSSDNNFQLQVNNILFDCDLVKGVVILLGCCDLVGVL